MIATLMILIGAKALAVNQTCQDTDLKKRVASDRSIKHVNRERFCRTYARISTPGE
jgi:hypothetical protein